MSAAGDDSGEVNRISRVESDRHYSGGPIYQSMADLNARHIAFAGWVVTAGFYGYGIANWNDPPVYAGFFLIMGFAFATALSGTVVTMVRDGDGE